MASEIFATRAELRRRLLAKLGATTDASVYSQMTEQLNEYLREGAQATRDMCEWKRTLCEFYFTTDIDNRFYNYPANVGPGDIVRIARWDADANQYVMLRRALILPILDNDPDLTGDDEIDTRAAPTMWEDSSRFVSADVVEAEELVSVIFPAIELNALPDAEYKMKIEAYAASPLRDDTIPCELDADCILLYAYAEVLESDGELKRAESQREKFRARIRLLAGAQRVGQTIIRGAAETTRLRYGRGRARGLNFDTSLSEMPPS